jgi:hypothetical protein
MGCRTASLEGEPCEDWLDKLGEQVASGDF